MARLFSPRYPFRFCRYRWSVVFDHNPAEVSQLLYASAASGLTAGVLQVNVRVPHNPPPGRISLDHFARRQFYEYCTGDCCPMKRRRTKLSRKRWPGWRYFFETRIQREHNVSRALISREHFGGISAARITKPLYGILRVPEPLERAFLLQVGPGEKSNIGGQDFIALVARSRQLQQRFVSDCLLMKVIGFRGFGRRFPAFQFCQEIRQCLLPFRRVALRGAQRAILRREAESLTVGEDLFRLGRLPILLDFRGRIDARWLRLIRFDDRRLTVELGVKPLDHLGRFRGASLCTDVISAAHARQVHDEIFTESADQTVGGKPLMRHC